MTDPFSEVSFTNDSYTIKFRKDVHWFFIKTNKKESILPKSKPDELIKFPNKQWVRLLQRDGSIYISNLNHAPSENIRSVPIAKKIQPYAYYFQVETQNSKKNYAYIFLIHHLSRENQATLVAKLIEKANMVVQESGTYLIALTPEYANMLKKEEVLIKKYRKRREEFVKAHMKQLGITDIHEYEKYMEKLNAKLMKEHLEKLKRNREKGALESKKRAEEAERIRRKQVDEETRKTEARLRREYELKKKQREYAGLTKEQIIELERKKKIAFEDSLKYFQDFEKGKKKSFKRIRIVLYRIDSKFYSQYKEYKHIPNYEKLKEIFPDSEEPQLLDAAFKAYIQLDFKSALSELNNMKSTDDDPRAIELKSRCLSRLGRYKECTEYYKKMIEKYPDNKKYKTLLEKQQKWLIDKDKIPIYQSEKDKKRWAEYLEGQRLHKEKEIPK